MHCLVQNLVTLVVWLSFSFNRSAHAYAYGFNAFHTDYWNRIHRCLRCMVAGRGAEFTFSRYDI